MLVEWLHPFKKMTTGRKFSRKQMKGAMMYVFYIKLAHEFGHFPLDMKGQRRGCQFELVCPNFLLMV